MKADELSPSLRTLETAMDRADLSKPPTDSALLDEIVRVALVELSQRPFVKISEIVRDVMRQCPNTVGTAQIVEEIVKQAAVAGVAIEFDG